MKYIHSIILCPYHSIAFPYSLLIMQEANLELPAAPISLTNPLSALSNPYPATINFLKRAQDGTSDYEAELYLVMGKPGRDISVEEAMDYVLGYKASNDVYARKLQLLTAQ
jgi:2-keto-4-pentenoate hydratase/2-oxohepta-3-ene-1,7-dioic acid hydratase in catechol pathway